MLIFIETVKSDSQQKSIRERSNENVSIRYQGADRNNIEVGKKSNEEEEKGEKEDPGPTKRESTQAEKGERDKTQDHIFRAKNRQIHKKRICCRVIDRKEKKFNVSQKHVEANQKVTCKTIPFIMFDAPCLKHHPQ
jgi:hypothetical protein